MAPTGLYDDPVVIDDKVDDTVARPQSFHQMKTKLDILKREIEEVIEMEEKKLRQQEERELSQFCQDHHIIMLDQEVEYENVNAMMDANYENGVLIENTVFHKTITNGWPSQGYSMCCHHKGNGHERHSVSHL